MSRETVLLTGAAGGVGLELLALLQPEYDVIAVVRDEAEAERVRGVSPGIVTVVADLADAGSLKPALAPHLAKSGLTLRAAVSAAAVWPGDPVELINLEELRKTFEINSFSPLMLYQAAIPVLRVSKGCFVLVSSISGKVALPFNAAYAMSKFAVEALGDVARREAGKWGVETVIIEPGPIKTPMVTGMMTHLAQRRLVLSPESEALYGELFDSFKAMVDAGYPTASDPADVARAVLDAIRDPDPETRIPIGDTAKFICSLPRTHDDKAIDAIAISAVTALRGGA
jgi:NAD(P)-dependent dehydrogenase (short-subunit alcohol dehydrogenase family)